MRRRITHLFMLLGLFVVVVITRAGSERAEHPPETAERNSGVALRFEADGAGGFVTTGPGAPVAVDVEPSSSSPVDIAGDGLSLRLNGADRSARLEGLDPYPGRTSY